MEFITSLLGPPGSIPFLDTPERHEQMVVATQSDS